MFTRECLYHVKWVPCHHGMAQHILRLWLEDTASRYGR